jgi:hypothetical protein
LTPVSTPGQRCESLGAGGANRELSVRNQTSRTDRRWPGYSRERRDCPFRHVWVGQIVAAAIRQWRKMSIALAMPDSVYPERAECACSSRRSHCAGLALNRPSWSPIKGSSASVCPHRLSYRCPTTIFLDPRDTDIISAQHFWTGGPETTGPGCYDAVAIARAAVSERWLCAGFRTPEMMRPHARSRPKVSRKIVA